MCGIWGFVSGTDSVGLDAAWDGLCSLQDRGPDDWGLYAEGHGLVTNKEALDGQSRVAIGNRRLSILDLTVAGRQPMCADERYWIVYNGELYNYRELRDDLAARGHTFDSDTDTEVLLAAYAEWGADAVERFRGMFAFAIWDSEEQTVFVTRDRLGIKPLYYALERGGLAFGSTVTSLLEAGVVDRTLDSVGIDGFLAFGSVPAPRTIVDGVRSLPPGSTLSYDIEADEVSVSPYWEPTFGQKAAEEETTLSPASVRELLAESVTYRLRSDVPVGAFLSGGLDSSSIVAAMLAAGDTDLRTFAITFDEDAYAEGDDAAAVAEALGTDHETHLVTAAEVREELDDVVAAMDQPTVDGVNTYFVSKAASDAGLKVALSGVGGDELFRGYSTFQTIPRAYRAARLTNVLPTSAREPTAGSLARLDPHVDLPAGELADLIQSDAPFGAAYLAVRGLFTRTERQSLLEDEAQSFAADIQTTVADTLARATPAAAVTHAECRWYLHNQLLRDTDAMSMRHSLEVRVPLLDGELVDAIASGDDSAFDGPGEKPLLRAAMADELPDRVFQKDKQGFTFPFAEWLADELRDVVDTALDPEQLATIPIDSETVARVRNRYEAGSVHWSRIWALVVLSLWVNEHIVTDAADSLRETVVTNDE